MSLKCFYTVSVYHTISYLAINHLFSRNKSGRFFRAEMFRIEQGFRNAGRSLAVPVGIDRLRHGLVCLFIGQEPVCRFENRFLIGADQLDRTPPVFPWYPAGPGQACPEPVPLPGFRRNR